MDGSLGSNSSVAGLGGGADVIGSDFFSINQRSFQIIGGVVLGF
jgi:hypothetical protein